VAEKRRRKRKGETFRQSTEYINININGRTRTEKGEKSWKEPRTRPKVV
jgi:hypothetical protein